MEFFDGRKVAFQSKVDSYGERQNARAPIPQSVTLRTEEVAGNRRAILKQRLDLGGSGRITASSAISLASENVNSAMSTRQLPVGQ